MNVKPGDAWGRKNLPGATAGDKSLSIGIPKAFDFAHANAGFVGFFALSSESARMRGELQGRQAQ